MEKYFKASLDKWSGGITLGVSVLFAAIAAFTFLFADKNNGFQTAGVISGLLFLVILVICFLLRPLGYQISGKHLLVKKPINSIKIPLHNFAELRALHPEELAWTIRTFGNGGIFGFYGCFWNNKLGSMTWYATQRRNYVLLKTSGKTYILTPDNPKGFIEAMWPATAATTVLTGY